MSAATGMAVSGVTILGYFSVDYFKEKEQEKYYINVFTSAATVYQAQGGQSRAALVEAAREIFLNLRQNYDSGVPPDVAARGVMRRIKAIPVADYLFTERLTALQKDQSILVCNGNETVTYRGQDARRSTHSFVINGRAWVAQLGSKYFRGHEKMQITLLDVRDGRVVLDVSCG